MTTIVIMPGGFHPYHAGHHALYQSAQRTFPDAEVYVAATNDTSSRPFPFAVKEKLARLAGVEAGHFVQVKSPFRAEEITSKFDPQKDVLIFVRSEKDAKSPPQPGGVKKDGSPSYLQPLLGARKLEPFAKQAYMAYLPTVEFGPGMTSATQIRSAWPTLNEKRKTALVMSLYPKTQTNPKLAQTVVKLLDAAIGGQVTENLDEAVGGNYLYHATSASGLKGMLSSGGIRSATGPQAATQAQTKLPTVSVTRDWGYASGSNAVDQMAGIGRDAILVLDRSAVESNFKTLGTSQNTNIRGLAFNPYLRKDGEARSQNTDPAARANAKAKAKYAEPTAKAGGEFEEAVVVPKGALPLKGTMVGFWINPKSELIKDPAIMNDPRRLDMVRPNQFVKATQQQGVTEDTVRSEAQASYMQGECMILAVAINQYNPQRYPIGYIWEYNVQGIPDMQLDDDEWQDLTPEEQQAVSNDPDRRSLVHAFVYDRETNEYIDARGRHKDIPNLWGKLGVTRFEKFPGSARELIDITVHGDWDQASQQVDFKRGQPAFDSLAGPAGVKRALDYAVKYLGIVGPEQPQRSVSQGIKLVDLDTDVQEDIYTLTYILTVDGKTVSFTYWDYKDNFVENPDINDIYKQAKEQLGKKLSPEHIEAIARVVFKSSQQDMSEGAPIVVAQAPIHIRNPKKSPQPYRNQGDIVPTPKPPSTEKRGVKGRPGQRPMPQHNENNDYLDE